MDAARPRLAAHKFASRPELSGSTENQEEDDDLSYGPTGMNLIAEYKRAFVAEYGVEGQKWLPEAAQAKEDLIAAAREGNGCFISGPSGCGKTLMAKWLATDITRAGTPVIFLAGRDFDGSWSEQIRRETELLVGNGYELVLDAFARREEPWFLILDAINELGSRLREGIREFRVLAQSHGARLVVTGQETRPHQFRDLRAVTVHAPSRSLKRRIASAVTTSLSSSAKELLAAVDSGLEANMVGHVACDLESLKDDATRVVLVDQYVRTRLGPYAREGSLGLRRFATILHENVAFSMAEREFDELMAADRIGFDALDALTKASLVVGRAGRVAFCHEMVQNGCAAYGIARRRSKDPVALGAILSTSKARELSEDIVSALDEATDCRETMRAVTNPKLLWKAASGRCGFLAKRLVRELLEDVGQKCSREIERARLLLKVVDDTVRVEWDDSRFLVWSAAEEARLSAIGLLAESGRDVGSYLALCRHIDDRLDAERRRLAETWDGPRRRIVSQSFSLAYLAFGVGIGIGFSKVCRSVQLGTLLSREVGDVPAISLTEATSGQLYFLTEHWSWYQGDERARRVAEQLVDVLRLRFAQEPYHVRLSILHAAGLVGPLQEDVVERLGSAVEDVEIGSNDWGLSIQKIETMKRLGRLDFDGEAAREGIQADLEAVLEDGDADEASRQARAICNSMTDHVFDWVYCEEIERLDETKRRRLFRLALSAGRPDDGTSYAWLCHEVAEWADDSDAPRFVPFSALPDAASVFPKRRGWPS